MTRHQVISHRIASPLIPHPLTLAVATDLHNGGFDWALDALRQADGVLIVGDLINRHRAGYDNALRFLDAACAMAPTFYSIGNHERRFRQLDEYWPRVQESAATILDNRWVPFGGITLGGLSSWYGRAPDVGFLPDMARQDGFRLLMCHHPEVYHAHVRPLGIDLTVAGHAHGGQVQLYGRGLYAPGQGLLPALTHGFYDEGRLLVSRGMYNSAHAPRINNPCELLMLRLEPMEV